MSRRLRLKGTTILVVDDDDSVRKFMAGALAEEGGRVRAAASGPEAIEKAQAEKFDAVVLDLRMPGMDGVETLAHLMERDPGLAVIVLTGYGSVESAREAMVLGARDYVTKPVDPGLLAVILAEAVRDSNAVAAELDGSDGL